MSSSLRPRRTVRVRHLVAAGVIAAAFTVVPATAHARPMTEPPPGTFAQSRIGTSSYCLTWKSTGDAWVYVGLSYCP